MRKWSYVVGPLALAFFLACNGAELTPAGGSSGTPGSGGSTPFDGGNAGDAAPRAPRDGGLPLESGSLPITNAVTIQVLPSDNAAAVLAAVQNAKSSVHMTMYLLTDTRFTNALVALKTAGKEVQVILNQNFPSPGVGNTTAYNALKAKGVDVRWAPAGYTYTHAKTIVIDGSRLLVMTMNLTQSGPSTNREYIATDTDPADVAVAEKVFAADFAGQSSFYPASTKLLLSPQSSSPLDARERLIALINGATKTLDVCGETLSDDPTVEALIAAKRAGVAVRIVLNQGTPTPAQVDSVALLKAAGVPIVSLANPDMHAKAIVADGKLAYVGSQNFTANSLDSNREMGLITDAAVEVVRVQSTIAADFAAGSAL